MINQKPGDDNKTWRQRKGLTNKQTMITILRNYEEENRSDNEANRDRQK
jgi:hypothetical protein